MSRKAILTVGCDLPGEDFEDVPFDSDRSLLDADIVLYEIGFGTKDPSDDWEGIPLFEGADSVKVARCLEHWRAELASAADAGKLVVIFLTTPKEFYKENGDLGDPEPVSSYEAVPSKFRVVGKSGNQVRLTDQAGFLSGYWREFGPLSPYQAFIDGEFSARLITTKSGDKTVGAAYLDGNSVLLLPPLKFDEDKYAEWDEANEEELWTADALKLGKRLAVTLVGLHETLRGGQQTTPAPEWALDPAYVSDRERHLHGDLDELARKIRQLEEKRVELEASIAGEAAIRDLLYEQGKPLERAVRDALSTIGFSVTRFDQDGSEFDVLFESSEGRCLGEVEGKDSKPIAVSKLSQLERNLQEDYARVEVGEFAKGVLFGNADRLTPPERRGEAFTPKCVTAAKRAGVALVRTVDLLEPVAYLRSNSDPGYAATCRQAIFSAAGEMVKFPLAPPRET